MLKNVGGIVPKVEYRDLLFMTLRDFEEQEAYLIKKHKVKVLSTTEIRKTGITKICREAMKYLSHCDKELYFFRCRLLRPNSFKRYWNSCKRRFERKGGSRYNSRFCAERAGVLFRIYGGESYSRLWKCNGGNGIRNFTESGSPIEIS